MISYVRPLMAGCVLLVVMVVALAYSNGMVAAQPCTDCPTEAPTLTFTPTHTATNTPTLTPTATFTPSPTFTPAPTFTPTMNPARNTLVIPSIHVHVDLTTFPLGTSTWRISPWERLVGHFERTDWFGPSNTVLGGHSVLPNKQPGVFYALGELQPGAEVLVWLEGEQRRYVVTEVYIVPWDNVAPVDQNVGERLTLITCEIPSLNAETGRYDGRVVVIAVPG